MSETALVIANNLLLKLDATGRFVATLSVSRDPIPLSDGDVTVLRAFATPSTVEEAALRSTATIDARAFADATEALRARGALVRLGDVQAEGVSPATKGFGSLITHHVMLRDATRTMQYRAAIRARVEGKVVVDVGCGSGVLSIFAAQAGAKHVYAIEETAVAEVARAMFHANGVADRVTLLVGNSFDLQPPEPADVVLHELLGTDPLYENILPVIDDMRRRWLRPGGRLLPNRLEILCAGVEAEFVPPILARARLEAREFRGLYGVDFAPYLALLDTIDQLDELTNIPRRQNGFFDGAFLQPILTPSVCVRDIDLGSDLKDEMIRSTVTRLPVESAGRLGSLLVSFRAHLDEQHVLSTTPYAPKSHWGWVVRDLPAVRNVEAGQVLTLRSTLHMVDGRQRIKLTLDT